MAVGSPNALNRKLIGIVVGLVIAGLGLGGAILYVNKQGQTSNAPVTTAPVMIASTDIPPGTKLDDTNTSEVQRPSTEVPTLAFALPADVTGKYAAIALAPAEILTARNTVATPLGASGAISQPPLDIPDNYVAMAIPNDPSKGVGGYIQAGDHIDFVIQDIPQPKLDPDGRTRYLLQDIKVVRLGQASQQAAAGGTATVDLMIIVLPRDQAEDLSAAMQSKSTVILRYVLRPRDQYFPETVLKKEVSTSDTSILVQHNTSLFKACTACGNLIVNVGAEQMQVTQVVLGDKSDKTVDVWTVSRGINNTPPAVHIVGNAVVGAAQYLSTITSPFNQTLPAITDPGIGPDEFEHLFAQR